MLQNPNEEEDDMMIRQQRGRELALMDEPNKVRIQMWTRNII